LFEKVGTFQIGLSFFSHSDMIEIGAVRKCRQTKKYLSNFTIWKDYLYCKCKYECWIYVKPSMSAVCFRGLLSKQLWTSVEEARGAVAPLDFHTWYRYCVFTKHSFCENIPNLTNHGSSLLRWLTSRGKGD